MKKRIIGLFVTLIACVGLCFGLVGCGGSKTVKLEVYTGEIQYSATQTIPVELTLDSFGTCTLVSAKLEMGGIYSKSNNKVIFKCLNGQEIATASLTKEGIILDYYGMSIELTKSQKTVKTDKLYGSYKGYIYDDELFELRMVFRGDNNWFLIEEDGDINDYGKYTLEGNSITAYYNDEPNKICAYGTLDGSNLSLNVEGDKIDFQKVNK